MCVCVNMCAYITTVCSGVYQSLGMMFHFFDIFPSFNLEIQIRKILELIKIGTENNILGICEYICFYICFIYVFTYVFIYVFIITHIYLQFCL